ncbi:MAG: pseudaminic acid synthase [Candidatus Wallbacteria bacterium GWC2_49_35]|uniref:Pseudaminic acid synthase n=1 Tax=Candidatus Wallbacteria bacterium GWC2_49_35 TaxID=1817813 RepID=A0A1F7WKH5_9BACT|nr:MAG: pseudaminic acid synthase [Candidatus Wallbacteria bacterium GWC2_49_35]HBC75169.1 pseudaminic acid synthase [Candidatus Wallbacteria bacterium]
MNEFKIKDRTIGGAGKTFIIAELSANHNHSLDTAKKTIQAAKEAGADAIKIQTYTADTLTIDCDNKYFRIGGGTLWDGQTLYKLYRQAYTPWEWHEELRDCALDCGLIFFSTPFDFSAVDYLEKLNVPVYKVASFEITDVNLIEYIASKNKPVIISTGIATLSEIEDAVKACKKAGNDKIALLKCTSAYPALPEDANLASIQTLTEVFGTVAGLSDHTMGSAVAVAAVALGAKIIEKHLILGRNLGGPDSQFSMEPHEFSAMAHDIRIAEKAVGTKSLGRDKKETKGRQFARSLFAVEDIKAGEEFTSTNVRSIRPGCGLAPKYLNDIIGKRAKRDIERGTPLSFDLLM